MRIKEPTCIILIPVGINFLFLFLNSQLQCTTISITMHCSNEAKKKTDLAPLLDGGFLCFGGAKIAI